MSAEHILVTGGAGFIGRRIVQALLHRGHRVRVLDSLIEQVHGGQRPTDGAFDAAEFVEGDVRSGSTVRAALEGIDAVVHLAAEVGVGQSMYEIDRYVVTNDYGTAVLFQALSRSPVRRVVTASSMSVYGEGLYRTGDGTVYDGRMRPGRAGRWDPATEEGQPLFPVATPESKQPDLGSVYALSKYVQERLTMIAAPAYGIEAVALRLFNVFGPGQALSNPYTGVLAIFASRLLNERPPLVFEDGQQRRDFVHVDDVADAFLLALEKPEAVGGVFNIGSGKDYSVAGVARLLADAMGRPDIEPEITGGRRHGDIRHCFADTAHARQVLGFAPSRQLEGSLDALVEWVRQQKAVDRVADARRELEERGLIA